MFYFFELGTAVLEMLLKDFFSHFRCNVVGVKTEKNIYMQLS